MTIFVMIVLSILYLGLPLSALLVAVYHNKARSYLSFILYSIFVIIYLTHTYIFGRWDWISIHLQIPVLLMSIPIIYLEWKKVEKSIKISKYTVLKNLSLATMILYFSFDIYKYSRNGLDSKGLKKQVKLYFPLRNGIYYIAHGGNTSKLNHHYDIGSQSFALDIVKLGKFGAKFKTYKPSINSDFHIWETNVYSPCIGIIRSIKNDLNDINPMDFEALDKTPREEIPGNFIFISCKNKVDVLLAHFKKNSILVSKGQKVSPETLLGKIGNSGNSTEPHLHIHAQSQVDSPSILSSNSKAVPILFDNKFLVRNDIIHIK